MDRRTFSDSYRQYADAIFRHCYFRVYDREQAKDLVQETFIKTWEYLSRGKKINNVRAFLYQTARNLVIDYFRSKREFSLDSLRDEGFQPAGNAGRDPQQSLENQEIRSLLLELKTADREIIVMRYLDELKPKEIAEIMKESPNVVSVRLHRASRAFRKICKKNGYQL